MRLPLVMPLALLVAALPLAAQTPAPADLVLLGGTILTVDAQDRVAQAVAVRGDRIVAVGTEAEARRLVGPRTRVVALHGRTVTPGLLDAHAHFSGAGGDRLFVLDLSYPNAKRVADVQALLRAQVAKLPPGTWIEGHGWDEGKLVERRLLTARDLDAAAPDNPCTSCRRRGTTASPTRGR